MVCGVILAIPCNVLILFVKDLYGAINTIVLSPVMPGSKLKAHKAENNMGLVAKKTVFRGLQTTKAQTSLHIRPV